MFKIAIVVFRESLEIALLISVIMAVTTPVQKSRIYIIFGAMLGLVLASLFAFCARFLSTIFGGMGDELFDSCVILLTAIIISTTVVWMQGYTSRIKRDLSVLSDKIASGTASQLMLILVVAITILREGVEILLFIYSITSTQAIKVDDYILGIGIGALSGILVGVIIYMGLIKFAGKYIFKISTILLILIAAGLAAEAAGLLTSAGIIGVMGERAWDSSWLIDDHNQVGKILKVLMGYSAKPNIMQVLFYGGTILLNIIMIKIRQNNLKIIND